jgi:hypothetical protein
MQIFNICSVLSQAGLCKRCGKQDKLNYIIDKLAADEEYVTILFGDPYIAEAIQSKLKNMTFSDSFPSLAAAIMKLTGRVLPDNY